MRNMNSKDVWISKKIYDDAEATYYKNLARTALTPLAGEVAKARQKLIESRDIFSSDIASVPSIDAGAIKFIEKKVLEFGKTINEVLESIKLLDIRVSSLEQSISCSKPVHEINVEKAPQIEESKNSKAAKDDDDDDVDLFGSSDEEDGEAAKIREERLAAYAAKKSKKPVLIAKSNVIFDVKPWDDETDMKIMEENVRKVECDGLLWGASKLVPLAYGIKKLQITCVVEDEKVSIDWLTEQIEAFEDYVQSVDIAAFNKI
ncbi:hypothetical protein GWI33_018398 [Rhynchophorus ferrugineus]|uniref:Elongation factor 1-delta n=1 Tax=Rhynchophorus ferrugineus TaxID=354439 RepID=A0A834HWG4_RHYFE|nr:hypothetical protein GWI33_018398 [Rhynchophorus ferrugineus]